MAPLAFKVLYRPPPPPPPPPVVPEPIIEYYETDEEEEEEDEPSVPLMVFVLAIFLLAFQNDLGL
jgi:hypothetical protein